MLINDAQRLYITLLRYSLRAVKYTVNVKQGAIYSFQDVLHFNNASKKGIIFESFYFFSHRIEF